MFQFTASDILAKLQSTEQLQGSLDGLMALDGRLPYLDKLLNIQSVKTRRGTVLIPTKEGLNTAINTLRDEYDTATHYIGLKTGDSKDFYIKKHDIAEEISMETVNSGTFDTGDLVEMSLRTLKHIALNNLDKIAIDIFTNPIIPSKNVGVQWNATNSTPLEDMIVARDLIFKSSGYVAKTDLCAVTSYPVLSALTMNAEFKNLIGGIQIDFLDEDAVIKIIKQRLKLKELIVIDTLENTAKDGQTPTFDWQAGDFFTIYKKGVSAKDLSFAELYRLAGEPALTVNPAHSSINNKAVTIEVAYSHGIVVKDATFAYHLKNIL